MGAVDEGAQVGHEAEAGMVGGTQLVRVASRASPWRVNVAWERTRGVAAVDIQERSRNGVGGEQ